MTEYEIAELAVSTQEESGSNGGVSAKRLILLEKKEGHEIDPSAAVGTVKFDVLAKIEARFRIFSDFSDDPTI